MNTISKQAKNKISTYSYFIKRLKDCNILVYKVFNAYSEADPRKWTVLVEPGGASIYVTCFENHQLGEIKFGLNDGNQIIPSNYYLVTSSIEVIVTKMLNLGVSTINK
jgi:hypothetical protein